MITMSERLSHEVRIRFWGLNDTQIRVATLAFAGVLQHLGGEVDVIAVDGDSQVLDRRGPFDTVDLLKDAVSFLQSDPKRIAYIEEIKQRREVNRLERERRQASPISEIDKG